MRKRVGVWLWAIPVLAASLIFWPIWLALLAGFALSWTIFGLSRTRELLKRVAEWLVARIAKYKYDMLAGSIGLAAFLVLVALFFVSVGGHDGKELTTITTNLAGYLAVAGLVLGLPALGYAMVTDSAVARIEIKLGITKEDRDAIEQKIGLKLKKDRGLRDFRRYLSDGDFVQVFLPDRDRSELLPVYDPDKKGPREGWGIDEDAPQAITGSVFVGKDYLVAAGAKQLRLSKFRLTEKQLREYKDLTAVAAAPILENGESIGVLTVSSASADSKIGTTRFRTLHERAAALLSGIVSGYIPKPGALEQQDLQ
jgi:hypothetical protein